MGPALARSFVKRYVPWVIKSTKGDIDPLREPVGFNKLFLNPPQMINLANLRYRTSFKAEDFFKFGIARNPFDRAVSMYHFLTRKSGRVRNNLLQPDTLVQNLIKKNTENFEEFIEFAFGSYHFSEFCMKYSGWTLKVILPQTYYLYDTEDCCLVDYIGQYENLTESWKYITKKINTPVELPWKNKSQRERDWEKYYSSKSKKIVKNSL